MKASLYTESNQGQPQPNIIEYSVATLRIHSGIYGHKYETPIS